MAMAALRLTDGSTVTVGRFLGAGGQGEVYAATDNDGNDKALKQHPARCRRLKLSAMAMAALRRAVLERKYASGLRSMQKKSPNSM